MATITPKVNYPVHSGSAFETTPPLSGTYIPAIWSGKMNAKFYATSTFSAVCNTDWEGEIKKHGDKVIIRERPDVKVSKYVAGQGLTYEHPAPTIQELDINQGHYFAFEVNDVLAYQSDLALLDTFTQEAAESMRTVVDSECWYRTFSDADAANKGATAGKLSGAYNLGTDTAPVTLTGDNVVQFVLSMASALDEQNVPDSDRWLVIDPLTRQMLFMSDLAKVHVTGDAASPVRNGMIGTIDRFKVYVSNLLPRAATTNWVSGDGTETDITASGGIKRRAIIAGHKSAMTFAGQITKNETLRNPKDFGDYVRGLKVYGRKVVKPQALVVGTVA